MSDRIAMARKKSRKSPTAQPRFFYGYFVVMAAFLSVVAMYAVYYSFGVFFKPMLNEFGWSRATASGAFSLSSIILGLLGIAMGGFTDKFGPRIVMTCCGIFLGLGYLLVSQMTSTVWELYLFYGIIIGTGMGGSFVPLMTTIARWFEKTRGLMTGIVASGIGIGALIGPPIANLLISTYGWRVSYFIIGSIVSLVVVLSAQIFRYNPAQVRQAAYGKNEGEQQRPKMGSEAIFPSSAVYTRQFWVIFAALVCSGFCVFAIIVHIAPHATELGIPASRAASILATIGGVSIIGKVAMGAAGDVIGSKRTFLIGFVLMSAALFWLVVAKMPWMLYSFAGVFGFGYGACIVSYPPLAAVLFGLSSHGLILGFLAFGFTIGGAIGPLVSGYLFDVTGRYQLAFLICAVISMAGLILSSVLRPRRVSEVSVL